MTMSALPSRASRGKRFRRVVDEEHDADEEFWGQEFFKEDEEDDPYLTESSKESVADSDFDDAESQNQDNSDVDEPLEKPRKKRLLPPGSHSKTSKAATVKRPRVTVKKEVEVETSIKTEIKDEGHEGTAVELRKSTLLRRTVAEEERRLQELHRVRRPRVIPMAPTMRLEEFLREVAEVESANLASFNELRAVEEASKKRAVQTRKRTQCPSIMIRSKKSGDYERTTLELTHATWLPKWLRRQPKPKPSASLKCVVTGLPAKYRDPITKLPYATIEAFRKIRESVSAHQ